MEEKPKTAGERKFCERFTARKILLTTLSLFFVILFKPQLVSADAWGKILNALWSAFNYLFNAILVGVNGLTVLGIVGVFRAMVWSLRQDPTVYPLTGGLGNMIRQFILLLYPFWVIALLLTAVYFIFVAVDPPRRYRAKSMLQKLLVGMVVTATSPIIYQLLINLSHGITEGILGPGGVLDNIVFSLPAPYNSVDMMFFMILPIDPSSWTLRTGVNMLVVFVPLMILLLFTILALAIVWFRYTAVILCAIFFPFTLFLYVFEATRGVGRELLKLTVVWIFTPIIMSVWLVALVALIPSIALGMNVLTGVMLLMSFSVVMIVSPLILSGLLAIIGAAVTAVGMMIPGKWGVALTAVGGLMQGQKASALIGAAMKYGLAKKAQAAKNRFKAAYMKRRAGGGFTPGGRGGLDRKTKKHRDKAKAHTSQAKQLRSQALAAERAGSHSQAQQLRDQAKSETRKARVHENKANKLDGKAEGMRERAHELSKPRTEREKTKAWNRERNKNERERKKELKSAKTPAERKQINDKYGQQRDGIDKQYNRGKHMPRVFDQKRGEQNLEGDAKSTSKQANPTGINKDEVQKLSKQGVKSRADLARLSDNETKKMAKDTGISESRLKDLRNEATNNVNREPTRREQKRMEAGKSAAPTAEDVDDERRLKDMLSIPGRRPKEKEDFMTAMEDQEQGQ